METKPKKIDRLLRQNSSEGSLVPLPYPLLQPSNPGLKKSYSENTLPQDEQAPTNQEALEPTLTYRWRCTLL